MEKHLYIIGNGFDIHHGINSSYRNFRDWMYENEPTIINDVEETYGCCDDEWWADFENQLGTLDVLEYARDIASENLPDLMSDHCDRTWNDAQIEVEQNLDGLYSNLRGCFSRWILQLSAPKREKMITLVKKNSLFLTFNYSKTLENLYKIPSDQILHIHGCIDDNEEFILGHGVGRDELQAMLAKNDPEPPSSDDPEEYEQWRMEYESQHQFHQQLAEEAAVNGVASQEKPVASLLMRYKDFFDGLYDVTHVHVYGMSFSEVDAPYLDRVAKSTRKAEWEISDYQGGCENKIKSFIGSHKITNFKVVELESLMPRLQLQIDFPKE
jgi:hypothetical protein